MKITIRGDSAADLSAKIKDLYSTFCCEISKVGESESPSGNIMFHGNAEASRISVQTETKAEATPEPAQAQAPLKKGKRGRPRKAVEASTEPVVTATEDAEAVVLDDDYLPAEEALGEPLTEPSAETFDTPPAVKAEAPGVIVVTKEEAFKALEDLNLAKGMDACRSVLKDMGVQRFSELKPEQYLSFSNRCTAARV